MLFRLIEGNSKAVYLFGVEDNGIIKEMNKIQIQTTIFNLKKITNSIQAKIKKFRIYKNKNGFFFCWNSTNIRSFYKDF